MTKARQDPPVPAIVVGVDFSDQSRRAFEAALRMARDQGAALLLVHAFPKPPAGSSKTGRLDPVSALRQEISLDEAMEVGSAWAKEARGEDVDAEVLCDEGSPADVVLRVARERDAGLVVVGTHGRTGLRRAVLGSVAEAIVRQAKVPVLVVP